MRRQSQQQSLRGKRKYVTASTLRPGTHTANHLPSCTAQQAKAQDGLWIPITEEMKAYFRQMKVHFRQQITSRIGPITPSQPNLQNIPVESDLGKKIRAAFDPAPAPKS